MPSDTQPATQANPYADLGFIPDPDPNPYSDLGFVPDPEPSKPAAAPESYADLGFIPEPETSFTADMIARARRGGAVAIGRTLQAIARGGQAIERLAGKDAGMDPAAREAKLAESSDLYQLGGAIAEGAVEAFPVDARRDNSLPAVIAESAGGMVPTLLAGAGGRLAAAIQYGLNSGEQAAQEAVAAGHPEAAGTAFAANAPIGALTEGLLGVAPRALPMLRAGARQSIPRALVGGAAREATQEALEQVGQNLVASDVAGYDPNRHALAGVPTAMAAGAILGGGVNAAAAALRNQSTARTEQRTAPIEGVPEAVARANQPTDVSPAEAVQADPRTETGSDTGTESVGPVSAMPTPPPGVPIAGQTRMPVTLDPIVAGRVDMPTVMQSVSQAVEAWGGHAPLRVGRFTQRARGIYNRMTDVIRLNSADNLPTATHEVGHAIAEYVWGQVGRAQFQRLARPLRQELMAMGRALYGNTRPNGGYMAEGWAEFVRLYLTTEEAPTRAPGLTRWFEGQVLPTNPDGAKALRRVRELADIWRGQGARGRAEMQMKSGPGRLARLKAEAQKFLSKPGMVDEAEPLRQMSRTAESILGRRLAAHEDPYLVLSAKRGTTGAILDQFLYQQPVTIWGNAVPGAKSLEQAMAPVSADLPRYAGMPSRDKLNRRMQDFAIYLWARRAQERWSRDQNPGMSLDDANHLRASLETPAFQLAAENYYKWWDSVLDYFASARPENAAIAARIRAGSRDYAPLPRVLDAANARTSEQGRPGGGLYRMTGSGLPIRNIWESTVQVANRLIARAHRDMVLEAILDLGTRRGTGVLIEEVPRSRVEQAVRISSLRQELERLGVDVSGIADDELLRYWTHAVKPTGSDPIIARQMGGQTRWFQVSPEVYDLLEGMEPTRLPAWADMLFGAPARLMKMGTTGLRASFAVTNLIRDFPTMMAQSVSDRNALARLGNYLAGWSDVVRTGLSEASGQRVKPSPWVEVFQQLGVQGGQWLGQDVNRLRRAARGVFGGRVFRRVTHPIETLRELINGAEMAPRLAEMRNVAADMGWAPGQDLTPEQAITIGLAAKRITTDFSAAGRYGRVLNQVFPFFNAALQGNRGFVRTFAGNRDLGRQLTPARAAARAAMIGFAYFTLPALVNWWRNKDKDWYHALPWRERFLYTNVEGDDGVIVQVPRSQEWGALFMALPEALFDAAWQADPKAFVKAFGHILEVISPVGVPDLVDLATGGATMTVPGQLAKEQAQNRTEFFDRPIVPEGQRFLPPGEQRGPYTSWLAKTLGDAFPDTISPRRVDHVIRGLLGGAFSDLVQVPDMAEKWALGTAEASDVPIVGRLFRRGGQYSAANQHLADLYDLQRTWMNRAVSKANPIKPSDKEWLKMLNAQVDEIQKAHDVANRTTNPDARRKIYEAMSLRAQNLLRQAERSGRGK